MKALGEQVGFKPINDDKHAIIEVVFGVTLSRAVTQREIDSVVSAHGQWKDKLPKLDMISFVDFAFGRDPIPQASHQQVSGVVFDRYKADGSLDMRLRVEETGIFINVLSYTRWAEVSKEAFALISQVGKLIQGEAFVTSAVLQYIDIFEWHGSTIEDYDISTLLKASSSHIPEATFHQGHLWHLHQGRYRTPDTGNGRLLERVNLDGVESPDLRPIVKLETYLQHQYAQSLAPHLSSFVDTEAMKSIFDPLHVRQKLIAQEYLTEEMCKRIKLND